MTQAVQTYALVRAASAFLSVLMRGNREVPSRHARQVSDAPRAPLWSGPRSAGIENRCPVCQARFRGARICSRCGAALELLMRLSVKAWQLRQAARQALDAGDAEEALRLAMEAQGVQYTERGETLRLLIAWLG